MRLYTKPLSVCWEIFILCSFIPHVLELLPDITAPELNPDLHHFITEQFSVVEEVAQLALHLAARVDVRGVPRRVSPVLTASLLEFLSPLGVEAHLDVAPGAERFAHFPAHEVLHEGFEARADAGHEQGQPEPGLHGGVAEQGDDGKRERRDERGKARPEIFLEFVAHKILLRVIGVLHTSLSAFDRAGRGQGAMRH